MIKAIFPFCVGETGVRRVSLPLCSVLLLALLMTFKSAMAQGNYTGAYITTVGATELSGIPCNGGTVNVEGLAVNPLAAGNVYTADAVNYPNDTVCQISPSGSVSVYQSLTGQLHNPLGMWFDAGNLFIADSSNFRVAKVDTSGVVTTYAGGRSTVPTVGGSGITPTDASITALDVRISGGNMYIAGETQIYMVTYSATTPLLTVYAGAGGAGCTNGPALTSTFTLVEGIAFDSSGDMFINDVGCGYIRELSGGSVSNYVGTVGGGLTGQIAIDPSNNLYYLDTNTVYEATAPGTAFAIAGNGVSCSTGCGIPGVATSAELGHPSTLTMDVEGNIFIANEATNTILELVNPPKVVFTPGIINHIVGQPGQTGAPQNGVLAVNAYLRSPAGIAMDSQNNLYIADVFSNSVREVSATTGLINTIAGVNDWEYNNGSEPICSLGYYSGDQGPATSAGFNLPIAVAVDKSGNVYISDSCNFRIREVNATTGIVNTIAGNGSNNISGDGELATQASVSGADAIAVDESGNVFIAENCYVRKVTAATGIISVVAGSGSSCSPSSDGSLATATSFGWIASIYVDKGGNLYIGAGATLRKVDAVTQIVSTVAGGGTAGVGDGGPATSATLQSVDGIAMDASENLYIIDSTDGRVREVSAASGNIRTIAGDGTPGYQGTSQPYVYFGDGGPANAASIGAAAGITVDSNGNFYFPDEFEDVIREVTVNPTALLPFLSPTPAGTTDTVDGPQTMIVTNNGGAPMYFASPSSGTNPNIGSDFAYDSESTCPLINPGDPTYTLAPGASCVYAVDFIPTLSGNLSETMVLTTNDPINPNATVTLTGVSQTCIRTIRGVVCH